MDLSAFASSKAFFEFSSDNLDPKMAEFHSMKGRAQCFAALLEKLVILPFAVLFKLYKTFFRSVGVVFSAVILLATFGTSEAAREFFVRRVSSLATDLADWVIYPFAIFICFSKLILASIVHPALYFRF